MSFVAEKLAAWSHNATEDEDAEDAPLQLTLLHYDDAFYSLQEIVETAVSHVRYVHEEAEDAPFEGMPSLAMMMNL